MRTTAFLILSAGILLAFSLHTAAYFYDVEKVTASIQANWRTQAQDLNVSEVDFCSFFENELAKRTCQTLLSELVVLKLENTGEDEITIWKIKTDSHFAGLVRLNDSGVELLAFKIENGEAEVNLSIHPNEKVFVALNCSSSVIFLMEDFSRRVWRCPVEG